MSGIVNISSLRLVSAASRNGSLTLHLRAMLRLTLAALHLLAFGIGLGGIWGRVRGLGQRPLDLTSVSSPPCRWRAATDTSSLDRDGAAALS
jgi:hypothetical protein